MKVSGTLTECDGVDPFASRDLLNQLRGTLNNHSPLTRFVRDKVQWTTTMSPGIEQTPTGQWSRLRVVTQKPEVAAPDFIGSQRGIIAMKCADCAGRFTVQIDHGNQTTT